MKKILIIMILMISMLMPSIVFATSSFEVGLASDKTEVKEGEIVTISISLLNLNVTTGEQGIGAYLAKIEYDSEIFEKVVFAGNTNWEGSIKNGNITGVTVDGKVVKQAQTIATLSLTVKENVKAGNTRVTISNFVGSDAVNDISANNKSIDIKIIEETNNQNQEDSNKNETNIENDTNNESNVPDNNNSNNNASDNTNSNNNANDNNANNDTTDNANSNNNANNDNSNNNESDNTNDNNNINNNTNNDASDNINNDNNVNDDNTNNDGNTGTTDTIISNEELPQTEDKIVIYGVFIVISLFLIIVIYIYYGKLKIKNKSSK